MSSLSIGIDFGTSNSGVAVYDGQNVTVLPVDSRNLTPQVVKTILYITRDYRAYIGQEAVELYYRQNVNRQRRFVKKWVGELDFYGAEMHYVRDVFVYVDELKPGRLLQYIKTALRSPGYEGTRIFDRYYSLSDLISVYLQALKSRAETLLGEPISQVTLGRPVKFSPDSEQDQRSHAALEQAAFDAGFKQVSFELEPVAAALYYEMRLSQPQNVLIFDFGGGTLDTTVMRLGDPHHRDIYANGGIGIAGTDFDRTIIEKRMLPHFGWGQAVFSPEVLELIEAVADWVALPELSTPQVKVKLETAIQKGQAPAQLKALDSLIFNDLAFTFYNAVEAAKIALSSQGASLIRMQEKDIDIWELYTRSQFEKDIAQQRAKIEQVVIDTVIASGLEPEQIDVVVKTGGSSNIPVFTQMLESLFSPEKVQASDIFSSVVAGLAVRGGRR